MDREIKYNEWIAVCIIIIVICGLGTVFLSKMARSEMSDMNNVSMRKLQAGVKGSIYAPGDVISVFGTCTDSFGIFVSNASAYLSSWYPNGTQEYNMSNMTQIDVGRFMWSGIMSAVQGTYLTELTCQAYVDGYFQEARAWGEWQNPFWVNEIINMSGNLSVDLSNLSSQIAQGFNNTIQNITFLNYTVSNDFNTTNNMILQTQVIANASVDRNDSLLAQLLGLLLNLTYSPPLGNLTWDEYKVDDVIIYKVWNIKVRVYNSHGAVLQYPEVSCVINTTQSALTIMDPEGEHFTYSMRINNWDPPFYWTTNCFYTP